MDIDRLATGNIYSLILVEFIYKFNKRYFGGKLFDRIIVAAIYIYLQSSKEPNFKLPKYGEHK
ncbi:hypothetical protein DN752_04200 [Echinicola strongylocentroti]|uniref:Uncharacterized protein n=1 Tax=Echinicola strongylocentroti TaxID=1795355 RepID=A0A2Z4IFZ0_9BACT|nr:hypothetical protein DN752_04200 [Echinicola strongylocentroti]